MALRLIQIIIPGDRAEQAAQLLEGDEVHGTWRDVGAEGRLLMMLVAPADHVEPLCDRFEQAFGNTEGFHLILLPVEAVLPRPEPEEEEPQPAPDKPRPSPWLRISREELYNEVEEGLGANSFFLVMAGLSSLVASLGLIADDLAVVIGAMVIAPLLAPNVALSLGTTLADARLIRRSLLMNLAGVTTALIPALIIGVIVGADPQTPAIAARTHIAMPNIVLALAAGAAGILAYTRGLAGPVIGVMVAVALLPPLAVFGMLLAAGHHQPALNALLLTIANVICVNLAGTGTLLLLGVRPRTWWEARRAEQATRRALVIWVVLLVALIAILVLTAG